MAKTQDVERYVFTVKESARIIAVSETMVRRLVAQNRIPHFTVGSAIRIPRKQLFDWMDQGGTNPSGKYKKEGIS